MAKFRIHILLASQIFVLAFNSIDINYAVRQDKKSGGFSLVFNDKTTKKKSSGKANKNTILKNKSSQKNKNESASSQIKNIHLIQENQPKRKKRRLFMNVVGGAAAGLVGGAALAAITGGGGDIKETTRKLMQDVRTAELKNDVERDNVRFLFQAKLSLNKVLSQAKTVKNCFEFLLRKKLLFLQDVLPGISV